MELKDALSELSVLANVLPINKIHSMLWILYADEENHYRDIVRMITEPVTFRISVLCQWDCDRRVSDDDGAHSLPENSHCGRPSRSLHWLLVVWGSFTDCSAIASLKTQRFKYSSQLKIPTKWAHKINWLVIRKKRIEGDTVCYTPLWEVNLNTYEHKGPEKFCDEDIFFYVCNLGCCKFTCS